MAKGQKVRVQRRRFWAQVPEVARRPAEIFRKKDGPHN